MTKLRRDGHRARQAEATRAAIARAARALFAERGYAATSMEAISGAAAIPLPTIYSAFGTKPAILEEVRRTWVLESQVVDLHAEAIRLPDSRQKLDLAAHWTRRQFDTGHDVIAVYQEVARALPAVAATWRQAMAEREAGIGQLLAGLGDDLRGGLGARGALDVYIALTVPEIYRTLVVDRSWSSDRYESWLAATLKSSLLEVPARAASSRRPAGGG